MLSYMPTYLSEELGFGASESFLATTIALAAYIGFIFLTGMASDRFGRKKMLIAASVLFIVLTVPAFALLDGASFLLIVLIQIILGGVLTLNDGTLPSFLAEMFPTRVRYTGFAFSFNLANAHLRRHRAVRRHPAHRLDRQRHGPGLVRRRRRGRLALSPSCASRETSREPLRSD